jgi:hypothetical protein
MTDSMEKIAKMAAKEAVAETFLTLGLDIKDPVSVQGQFAFLRNLYYGTRQVRNVVIAAGVTSFVGGLAWALWTGIKVGAALAGR